MRKIQCAELPTSRCLFLLSPTCTGRRITRPATWRGRGDADAMSLSFQGFTDAPRHGKPRSGLGDQMAVPGRPLRLPASPASPSLGAGAPPLSFRRPGSDSPRVRGRGRRLRLRCAVPGRASRDRRRRSVLARGCAQSSAPAPGVAVARACAQSSAPAPGVARVPFLGGRGSAPVLSPSGLGQPPRPGTRAPPPPPLCCAVFALRVIGGGAGRSLWGAGQRSRPGSGRRRENSAPGSR